jgi:hypothetical protein
VVVRGGSRILKRDHAKTQQITKGHIQEQIPDFWRRPPGTSEKPAPARKPAPGTIPRAMSRTCEIGKKAMTPACTG